MNWEEIKKHKNILIGVGIVLVLAYIFLSVVYAKNMSGEKVMTGTDQSDPTGINQRVDVEDLVNGISQDYKESATFQECIAADMGIQTCQRESIYEKVRETGDTKYCQDFAEQGEANNCVLSYVSTKAAETGDVKYCASLVDNKTSCEQTAMMAKATMTGDVSICESLEDEIQKNACAEQVVTAKAIASLDESLCATLTDFSVDMCKDQVQFEKEQMQFQQEEEARQEEEQERLAAEQEQLDAATAEAEAKAEAEASIPEPVAENLEEPVA